MQRVNKYKSTFAPNFTFLFLVVHQSIVPVRFQPCNLWVVLNLSVTKVAAIWAKISDLKEIWLNEWWSAAKLSETYEALANLRVIGFVFHLMEKLMHSLLDVKYFCPDKNTWMTTLEFNISIHWAAPACQCKVHNVYVTANIYR